MKLSDRLDAINRQVGRLLRWLVLGMVLIQFAIVVLRYVFSYSNIAVGESVLYLHAAVLMLGAGYTLMIDGHVRVDIFYSKLDEKARARIDLFGHLVLLIPSMLILMIWSWPSVRNAWSILEGPISVGGIPASFLLKTFIPLFCVLLIIQSVSCLVRDWFRLRS